MKSATGTGLVIVGFILLYLAITDKLDCLFSMFDCAFGTNTAGSLSGGVLRENKLPTGIFGTPSSTGGASRAAPSGWRDFRSN